MKTPQEIITELERIDAEATNPPWQTEYRNQNQCGIYSPYPKPKNGYDGEHVVLPGESYLDKEDSDAICFLRNHCGKLAEMLKVAVNEIQALTRPAHSALDSIGMRDRAARALNQLNTISARP